MAPSARLSLGSIREGVSECITSLRRLGAKQRDGERRGFAETRKKTPADLVGDLCDRLSLWSQDVGATNGHLDGLLAQSSSLRIHILNLLVDLKTQISELSSVEDEEAIEEIIDLIESLFHLEPALIDPAPLDRCSSTQQSSSLSEAVSLKDGEKRCTCGQPSSGTMIACVDEACLRQWFHLECVGLKEVPIDTNWYCFECKASRSKGNPALNANSHKPDEVDLIGERRRATSKKPDVDIITVSGVFGLSSWLSTEQLDHEKLADTWLATLLPDILEENGIYARILSFRYETPDWFHDETLNLEILARKLVKQVSTERNRDPERPLFFLCHSFGGILAKQTICTLIDEGLSVNTASPVCGCLFFSVPHDTSPVLDSALGAWFRSLIANLRSEVFPIISQSSEPFPSDMFANRLRILAQVNEAYKKQELQYRIPVMNYYEPSLHVLEPQSVTSELLPLRMDAEADHSGVARFSRDQREYILPAIHQIARIVETASAEWRNEIESDYKSFPAIVKQQALLNRQREDPFAMLAGYNTAILINDCLTAFSPNWSAVVDIARDLVDVVTNYDTEDVDIQLSNQAVQSFSVKDGMQASKLLSRVQPAGDEWDFESQLERYIVKYLKSKSSRLANGKLRPVNMIILTGASPRANGDSFYMALEKIAGRSGTESSLDLRMQFVQLERSPGSAEFWAACLQSSNQFQTRAPNIAPVHYVDIPYVSDAAVCQRILLGAITNRFHEVPALSDCGGITATGSETMSISASMGSVDGAGHRNTMGGAVTYASSMTSGDIHMMDEDECKPYDVSMEPTDYHSLHNRPQQALPPGLVDEDESKSLSTNIEPASVSLSQHSPTFDASNSPSVVKGRDYILELADPTRSSHDPLVSGPRVQKHPASFQCNLCPKKFIRAYNLRSHLRTHTDERPFVCSVCGKAFARQHDRKRHEGLHSGEKKFVCRGELPRISGQVWGCGRRFARADALGRHFRSEAGRTCIKPLIDEEEAERRSQTNEGGNPKLMLSADLSAFYLPAALFAQYPALANIDWAAVEPKKTNVDPGELSDMSDRSDSAQYWDHSLENDTYTTEPNPGIQLGEDPTR